MTELDDAYDEARLSAGAQSLLHQRPDVKRLVQEGRSRARTKSEELTQLVGRAGNFARQVQQAAENFQVPCSSDDTLVGKVEQFVHLAKSYRHEKKELFSLLEKYGTQHYDGSVPLRNLLPPSDDAIGRSERFANCLTEFYLQHMEKQGLDERPSILLSGLLRGSAEGSSRPESDRAAQPSSGAANVPTSVGRDRALSSQPLSAVLRGGRALSPQPLSATLRGGRDLSVQPLSAALRGGRAPSPQPLAAVLRGTSESGSSARWDDRGGGPGSSQAEPGRERSRSPRPKAGMTRHGFRYHGGPVLQKRIEQFIEHNDLGPRCLAAMFDLDADQAERVLNEGEIPYGTRHPPSYLMARIRKARDAKKAPSLSDLRSGPMAGYYGTTGNGPQAGFYGSTAGGAANLCGNDGNVAPSFGTSL